MKVQSINSSYYAANNNSCVFGAKAWNMEKLEVIGKDAAEIREIAEYFHKSSENELRQITGSHFFRRNDRKAYNLLKSAIDFVNNLKDIWKLKLELLTTNETTRELNESEKLSKQDLEQKIKDLDDKFNARKEKFQEKTVLYRRIV